MNSVPPYASWSHPWLFIPNSLSPTTVGTLPPTAWIDTAWQPPDLEKILQYLANAPIVINGFTPPFYCCLCGNSLDAPAMWRWDGAWLWPHDLVHLIRVHSVRPPDSLVEHIRRAHFAWPAETNVDTDAGNRLYDHMWRVVDPDVKKS